MKKCAITAREVIATKNRFCIRRNGRRVEVVLIGKNPCKIPVISAGVWCSVHGEAAIYTH